MNATTSIILVPVDLEGASMKALELARDFASKLDMEVVLVHVYTLPRYGYPGLAPALLPDLDREIAGAARRAAEDLGTKSGGLRVLLREGDPATEILDAIRETSPRLVVMGTHGRTGMSRIFLGSVAEKVIRRSPVPVLTVRAPAEETSA